MSICLALERVTTDGVARAAGLFLPLRQPRLV